MAKLVRVFLVGTGERQLCKPLGGGNVKIGVCVCSHQVRRKCEENYAGRESHLFNTVAEQVRKLRELPWEDGRRESSSDALLDRSFRYPLLAKTSTQKYRVKRVQSGATSTPTRPSVLRIESRAHLLHRAEHPF